MKQKKYWQSIGEITGDPAIIKRQHDEFSEELPLEEVFSEKASKIHSSRRDFLKMLGFSVSAATVAASCEIPVKKAIPYIVKPEEITPGKALYYASTFMDGMEYASVLVKTREGRPIKIEGNELSSINKGKTNARAQAAVLSLYDTARLRGPKKDRKEVSWEEVDKEIIQSLTTIKEKGGNIAILSSSIISPSTKELIKEFSSYYGNVSHVSYDPISYNGLLSANKACFGQYNMPEYHFNKAEVIVSIDADFLNTWGNTLENTRNYVAGRIPKKDKPTMSRHIHIEPSLSMTGSNADFRATMKPSFHGSALLNLYNNLAVLAGVGQIPNVPKVEFAGNVLGKAAKELWQAKGKSIVVSGSNDTDEQIVVNAINSLLGNYGNTITFTRPYNTRQGNDKMVMDLVKSMQEGKVDALFIYNANPSYSLPQSEYFNKALKNVSLTVSFNDRMDETTSLVQYACPDHHFLEAWGDAEPKKGIYSFGQPTIAPIFKTRAVQDSLLKWTGKEQDYYSYLKMYWEKNMYPKQNKFNTFQSFWDNTLRDGVFEIEVPVLGLEFKGDVIASARKVIENTGSSEAVELVLYEKVGIGDGRYAGNPFLQELPDPVSRTTWDNYACVSPKFAKEELGIDYVKDADIYSKEVIEIRAGENSIKLPVLILPGQAHNVISVALGYGREKAGKAGDGVGQNVYPFIRYTNDSWQRYRSNISVKKANEKYDLAIVQTHHLLDGTLKDRTIVREMTLAQYKNDPATPNKKMNEYVNSDHFVTLYEKPDYSGKGHHWAMAIDLNACTGCGSCVVACNAENNVPVVGKTEVRRNHEMHWMRIDRYFTGDPYNPDSIDTTYQPMLCQHCDNAPCENVCPVAATTHSNEGLNQMTYNRCVGTRYCENNCPYKVRRFNWFDYQGADSFYIYDNDTDAAGMLEDLTRMVLNPDVTIRSRGVMEKCSFCAQRIQEGKLNAKKENRSVNDGEIKSACQQACPANAIVFGDLNDKNSEVSKLYKNERTYNVLAEIHTLPSIGYMAKVRNKKEGEEA